MKPSLFELRGSLSKKQNLLLNILGLLVVLLVWFMAAHLSVKENILPDRSLSLETIEKIDDLYYHNDSLRSSHYDEIAKMDVGKLQKYGLKKQYFYPILPPPEQVGRAFIELWNKPASHDKKDKRSYLLANTLHSIYLNIMGYTLAISLALPIGFLLGLIPLFRGLFSRIFDSFRFIPLTAVTSIFVLWFGIGSNMKITFLAFGILVYLVPVVVQRIDEVRKVYLQTVFTLGASALQTIRTVYIPSVLSRIFDDIRVLTAISWTYINIVEMINNESGIGAMIFVARRQSRLDYAFVVLIVIVLIGIVQDRIFVYLDRLLFPYKHLNDKK